MEKSEQNGSDYEIYRGLTAEQIEISLDLELSARTTQRYGVAAILEVYAAKDIPVTKDLIRRHAEMVHVDGWSIELPWLEQLAKRGDPEPFRLLCVEQGLIEDALRVLGHKLSDDDVKKMVKIQLRTRTRDERNFEGLRLGYLRLKNREGLRYLLSQAIKYVDIAQAQQLAKDLKTRLSLIDRKKMAEMVIRRKAALTRLESVDLFSGHGMGAYRKRLLQANLKQGHISIWELQTLARDLALKVPISHLERKFRAMGDKNWNERIAVAEELGKRSYVWRRRLPKVLEATRELALLDGKIMFAEEYGHKCGKPLSVEELEELLHSERNQEKGYTRHLLALRIHERLNGPSPAVAATG